MYERLGTPPLSRLHFIMRLLLHGVVTSALILGSLVLGIIGYMSFEHLSLTDAFLNASMLLGGMGPVDPPHTEAGKLFAGFYALYSGLVVLIAAGIIFTPVLHRVMHKLHWEAS
jgi:hypothetical protein